MGSKKIENTGCHAASSHPHPDHSAQIRRLNRIAGQLEGIRKMIVGRRYCPDILTQVKAAASAMKSLEAAILETHIESCVHDAMTAGNAVDVKKKVKELMKIFRGSSSASLVSDSKAGADNVVLHG